MRIYKNISLYLYDVLRICHGAPPCLELSEGHEAVAILVQRQECRRELILRHGHAVIGRELRQLAAFQVARAVRVVLLVQLQGARSVRGGAARE